MRQKLNEGTCVKR